MTDKIEENLLKGCGKDLTLSNNVFCGEYNSEEGVSYYCVKCRAKLKQHRETKKAMNEKFEKLIEECVKDSICKLCGERIKLGAYCWENHMDSKHEKIDWRKEDSDFLSKVFRDLEIEELRKSMEQKEK